MDDEQILINQAAASRLAAIRVKRGVQYMMGNRAGRSLMWHLLEQYGVFQEGFNPDPAIMGRASGRRSAGLQLMQLIDSYTPEKYAKMTEEAREDALSTDPMGEE